MDYINFSKEQLIQMVEELKMLNDQLLKEKEQETDLDFAWAGNLGHWYWNVKTNTVTFNPLKVTTLGYSMDEVPEKTTYQFFTDLLHPEDYQNTMDVMLAHLQGRATVYEAEYRIRAKDGSYRWYYDRGKVTQRDEAGHPLFLAGIVFDINEKKKMQLELETKNGMLAEQAMLDGLTKVKNHRSLIECLNSEIAAARRTHGALSIALFDLDDFKQVNDRKGHLSGDKVLVDAAKIMRQNIRDTDVIGRYGGEEFMIILSNANRSNTLRISDRVRQAIAEHRFFDDMQITVSGGIKEYDDESISDFIRLADENLYRAKAAGKNRVV